MENERTVKICVPDGNVWKFDKEDNEWSVVKKPPECVKDLIREIRKKAYILKDVPL